MIDLTFIEIDQMQPGKEIDALIAEWIIGLEPWPGVTGSFRAPIIGPYQTPVPCLPPSFSTDLSQAWGVIEKMQSEDWFWTISPHEPFSYIVYMGRDLGSSVWSIDISLPMAICKVALKTEALVS